MLGRMQIRDATAAADVVASALPSVSEARLSCEYAYHGNDALPAWLQALGVTAPWIPLSEFGCWP
jgi:hypothetical protein